MEDRSDDIDRVYAIDHEVVTWWGTVVECESALARRERDGHAVAQSRELLGLLASSWQEVAPTEALRRLARRLVRTHAVRGADAYQLAAALTAADGDPESMDLLTYGIRIAAAARREGFRVLSPGS